MLVRLVHFFIFCFFLYSYLLAEQITYGIDLLHSTELQYNSLIKDLSDYNTITCSIICSDTHLAHEATILLGCSEQNQITRDQLRKGLGYIQAKKRFESVSIALEGSQESAHLILTFIPALTISRVTIQGDIQNNELIEQVYHLHTGDIFDHVYHQNLIDMLKRRLSDDGYLAAQVIDTIKHDENKKTVVIDIEITHAEERALITAVVLDITFPEGLPSHEAQKIRSSLKEMLEEELYQAPFSVQNSTRQYDRIKDYLANQGFLHVQIKTTHITHEAQVTVQYDISIPHKKKFVFVGNTIFSSALLIQELLGIGTSLFMIPAAIIADDIRGFYKKKGFWNAEVEVTEESYQYIFTIHEGARVSIDRVRVREDDGAELQTDELKKIIQPLIASVYYEAELLKQVIEAVIALYRKNGYWDVTVLKQEHIPLHNHHFELVLSLEKGVQRLLYAVRFDFITQAEYETEPFKKLSYIPEAIPFDVQLIDAQQEVLKNQYKQMGIQVELKPEVKRVNERFELIWHMTKKGLPRLFGDTIVVGTTKLPSELIMRELCYKQGDMWQREKIDQSIKRLKDLRMFKSVSLTPQPVPEADEERKTVLLKCIDDDPFEITTRLGLAQVSNSFTHLYGTTFRVGGSFLWKNLSNRADILRIDGDLTRYTRNFSTGYEVPWLWSWPIRTSFTFYVNQFEQPIRKGSSDRLYKETHEGFSIGCTKTIFDHQGAVNLGWELMKISSFQPHLSSIINFEPQFIDKREPYFFIEPSYIRETYDTKIDPTRGSSTYISLRALIPFKIPHGSYVKLYLEHAGVSSIWHSLIGAYRVRLGHIFNAPFSRIMPTERFYLGGPTTVRSYEPDMVPPLNAYHTKNDVLNWVPIGGKTMFNLNGEVRFPIYRKLGGVIFNDIGVLLQDTFATLDAQKIVAATGCGLRYATPIGPLRFDIGWKWQKRRPDDKPYEWFLTIGHAF